MGDAILALTERFGLVTVEMLVAVLGLSPNAVVKRLLRRERRGEFVKCRLIGSRHYWHRKKPLGTQALARRFAVMAFCCLGESHWELERWDGPAAVCSRVGRREAVVVDLGGPADHVARRKLRDFCAERQERLASYAGLSVLTPTAEKARKIGLAAREHTLPLPVRCVVIEDLFYLLAH